MNIEAYEEGCKLKAADNNHVIQVIKKIVRNYQPFHKCTESSFLFTPSKEYYNKGNAQLFKPQHVSSNDESVQKSELFR